MVKLAGGVVRMVGVVGRVGMGGMVGMVRMVGMVEMVVVGDVAWTGGDAITLSPLRLGVVHEYGAAPGRSDSMPKQSYAPTM